MKKLIGLLFLIVVVQFSFGQVSSRVLSDKAHISVLTCGTGDQLYSLFGHTAIRVYDPAEGIDRVYNYGMFDFNTPNFYAKFIKGDLLYFVDYDGYKNFVVSYAYDNRSVVEQELNLTPEQKQKIWNNLNESLAEENRSYVYKFIDQNCTTKVVDLINGVLPTKVEVAVDGNTGTYRAILNTYLSHRYFEKLGINLIFGSKVDQVTESLFLPDKFQLGLASSMNGNQPLVKQEQLVFQPEPSNPSIWWNTYWFASVVFALVLVATRYKVIRTFYFVFMGVFGLFFLSVGFYSLHSEVLVNNVILLCNPLFLLLPFVKKYFNFRNILGLIVFLLLILYVVLNFFSEKLIITLPLLLLTFGALIIEFKSTLSNTIKNK